MPTPHQPLRVAIIGTGGIAHAHAQAVVELAGKAILVAVADVDAERAQAFAAEFGAERSYTDAASLFAGEELDLVHVCTPPQSHVPLALQAQKAGVAALVEKPIALSLREMGLLVASERETGVPVLTVFQHRFGQAALRLRTLAESGALGRPQVATCETMWYRDDDYFAVPWRGRWDVEGVGPTMGHGIHQFDLLLAVLGPWSRVSAFAARQSRPTDTEDVSIALAEFKNGALATVVNSVVSPRETSRLRFDYEFATAEVEHLWGYTNEDWTFTPAPGHEQLAELWDSTGGRSAVIGCRSRPSWMRWSPVSDRAWASKTLTALFEFAAATYASAFRGVPVRAGDISPGDPFFSSMSGGAVPWAPVKEVAA